MEKRKRIGPTLLARWLLDYVDAHNTDLTACPSGRASVHPVESSQLCSNIGNLPAPFDSYWKVRGRNISSVWPEDGYEAGEDSALDRLELPRSYQELPRQMCCNLYMVTQALEKFLATVGFPYHF